MANRKLECHKVFMGSSLIAIAAALIANNFLINDVKKTDFVQLIAFFLRKQWIFNCDVQTLPKNQLV